MQIFKKKGPAVITCNECGRIINKIKPRTKRTGDIEHKYFVCRRCGAVYVISVTDEALRQNVARFEKMTDGKVFTPEKSQEARLLLQANVARSRELKEQYPLELKAWERR
jgi:hypothetical protein